MYSDIVTLFNYHEASDTWYPTILYGVDLGERISSVRAANRDELDADKAVLLINCNSNKTLYDAFGEVKSYTTPKEYAACENPEKCFTFKPDCDFFISGAIELGDGSYIVTSGGLRITVPEFNRLVSEITEHEEALESYRDSDYENGLYQAINEINDSVYLIEVVEFFGLLPHFEIEAR